MHKKDRQEILINLIRLKRISSQHELLKELAQAGVHSNQATISRDLSEVGISKIKRIYHLPQIGPGESNIIDSFQVESAGDHLIVLRTSPGRAPSTAAIIDNLKLSEIVGTIAGDDTLFIATKSRNEQSRVIKSILKHFRR